MVSLTMEAYCQSDKWIYCSVPSGGFSMEFEGGKIFLNYINLTKNYVGLQVANAA